MKFLLDTGILGQLCHPAKEQNQPVTEWVRGILLSDSGDQVCVPEVCDYELRRKLLHLVRIGKSTQRSVEKLDELCAALDYIPLETTTMRLAADLWADARVRGIPTAPKESFDGDVILAAQATLASGMVITSNRKHLSQFVSAHNWSDILWGYAFVCIRGPVENLAFDWTDHFIVSDIHGRTWHCRHEATWYTREELEDSREILNRLMSDVDDVLPMYRKLFKSGHGTTEGTKITCQISLNNVPSSIEHLKESLARSLAEDDSDSP